MMISDKLKKAILAEANAAGKAGPKDLFEFLYDTRELLHKEVSPVSSQPVDLIRWVDINRVRPNDYNPNSVAQVEMRLLYMSILNDGYTQPVVTVHDPESDTFVIVDGFHRYFTCLNNPDILARNHGFLPIVVIDKPINDRMASTVRHNRARGKHSVDGMASMIFAMLENGWEDEAICNEMGMEAEELLRLKHITGFSKLFKDTKYKQAWETRKQIRLRMAYEAEERGKAAVKAMAGTAAKEPAPAPEQPAPRVRKRA